MKKILHNILYCIPFYRHWVVSRNVYKDIQSVGDRIIENLDSLFPKTDNIETMFQILDLKMDVIDKTYKIRRKAIPMYHGRFLADLKNLRLVYNEICEYEQELILSKFSIT